MIENLARWLESQKGTNQVQATKLFHRVDHIVKSILNQWLGLNFHNLAYQRIGYFPLSCNFPIILPLSSEPQFGTQVKFDFCGTVLLLTVQEILWLRDLLRELEVADDSPSVLNMDNHRAVYLTWGASDSNKTKHIDIRYHFIHSRVEQKRIKVQYTPMDEMVANILTKNLGRSKHNYFISKLELAASPFISWLFFLK